MNNYIKELQYLFYSPSASSYTQKVYSFMDSELARNILCIYPLKWQDQCHLIEKCYPEGVKPLLLILEHIEVAHPVDEKHMAGKPAKSQGSKQSSRKFVQGTCIPRKRKLAGTKNARVEKKLQSMQNVWGHAHHV